MRAGLLNTVIGLFIPGFAHPWLGDANTALWALMATASWGGVGLPLMLCFASVQAIPRTVLEAAYLDGATPTSDHGHIMVPLSLPGRARRDLHQPAGRPARLRHHLSC